MLTFIAVVGGAVLILALVAVVYLSGRRKRSDETGRMTEAAQTPAPEPPRAQGREA